MVTQMKTEAPTCKAKPVYYINKTSRQISEVSERPSGAGRESEICLGCGLL